MNLIELIETATSEHQLNQALNGLVFTLNDAKQAHETVQAKRQEAVKMIEELSTLKAGTIEKMKASKTIGDPTEAGKALAEGQATLTVINERIANNQALLDREDFSLLPLDHKKKQIAVTETEKLEQEINRQLEAIKPLFVQYGAMVVACGAGIVNAQGRIGKLTVSVSDQELNSAVYKIDFDALEKSA